jgi:hypothetical protein
LRAKLAKRIALLRNKGYVDLAALPPPEPAPDLGRANGATAAQSVGAK